MQHIDYNPTSPQKSTSFIKKIFSFFRYSPTLILFIIVFFVMVLTFWGIRQATSSASSSDGSQQSDQQTAITKPTVQKNVNKTFTFPLKDQQGQEVGKLSYTIESVELRDQIIVQGQPANAIKGKKFLIINVKLTNSYDKTVQVNARDYLRVSVGNSSEKLAPDMHSDPVEVQAISTKSTRLGMAINETDKNIIIQVGEITGKKENIEISL